MIREVGDALVMVNVYNYSEDYAEHLPTLDHHTWSADLELAR